METVIFRKYNKSGGIIALFPYIHATIKYITCYQHVGQHGQADYHHVIDITLPAKESEYKELYDELTLIVGYDLDVKMRIDWTKYSESREEFIKRWMDS